MFCKLIQAPALSALEEEINSFLSGQVGFVLVKTTPVSFHSDFSIFLFYTIKNNPKS